MSVTKPSLPEVRPGDPISAELWNRVTQGTLQLYDLTTSPVPSIKVRVSAPWSGMNLAGATVLATSAARPDTPWIALPYGQGYLFGNLAPGDYTVTVAKDGYNSFTQTVTVEAGLTAQVDTTLFPEQIDVPDLVEMTLPQAIMTIDQWRLRSGVVRRPNSILSVMDGAGTVPLPYREAKVLSQSPASGEQTYVNGFVALTVQAMAVMPVLEGQPLANAIKILRGLEFETIQIDDRRGHQYTPENLPETYGEARVVEQGIAVGAAVPITTAVQLKIEVVEVPDVQPLPMLAAMVALQNAGLRMGALQSQTSQPIPLHEWGQYQNAPLTGQWYVPGTLVARGTGIILTVVKMTQVPNLVGLGLKQAEQALINADLTLWVVTNDVGERVWRNQIDSYYSGAEVLEITNHSAGEWVQAGTKIDLKVCEMVEVPTLQGNRGWDLDTLLTNGRVTLGAKKGMNGGPLPGSWPNHPEINRAYISGQNPAPGVGVRPGSAVDVHLAAVVPDVIGVKGGSLNIGDAYLSVTETKEHPLPPGNDCLKVIRVCRSISPGVGTRLELGSGVKLEMEEKCHDDPI